MPRTARMRVEAFLRVPGLAGLDRRPRHVPRAGLVRSPGRGPPPSPDGAENRLQLLTVATPVVTTHQAAGDDHTPRPSRSPKGPLHPPDLGLRPCALSNRVQPLKHLAIPCGSRSHEVSWVCGRSTVGGQPDEPLGFRNRSLEDASPVREGVVSGHLNYMHSARLYLPYP